MRGCRRAQIVTGRPSGPPALPSHRRPPRMPGAGTVAAAVNQLTPAPIAVTCAATVVKMRGRDAEGTGRVTMET